MASVMKELNTCDIIFSRLFKTFSYSYNHEPVFAHWILMTTFYVFKTYIVCDMQLWDFQGTEYLSPVNT